MVMVLNLIRKTTKAFQFPRWKIKLKSVKRRTKERAKIPNTVHDDRPGWQSTHYKQLTTSCDGISR